MDLARTKNTRCMVFLPVPGKEEQKAFHRVVRYLKEVTAGQDGKKLPARISGFTQSSLPVELWINDKVIELDAAFIGYWWSTEQEGWCDEDVVVIIIDHELRPWRPRFRKFLNELALEIHRSYEEYKRPQEAVLISTNGALGYLYKSEET